MSTVSKGWKGERRIFKAGGRKNKSEHMEIVSIGCIRKRVEFSGNDSKM